MWAREERFCAGMRASLGVIAIEFPTAYAAYASEYLKNGLATRDAYKGEALLSFCLAPHAPYTVGDETMRRIAVLAEELDVVIHCHVHEPLGEIEQGLAQHGLRPFEQLRKLGLVGPRLIAVHSVHLNEHELDTLSRVSVSVAHCPSSNLKLASGIAPVAAMRKRGIRVGVGTDGAASNNRLDVFTGVLTAALVAKGARGDPSIVPAHVALEMATIEGARALGLEAQIGSIATGKAADLAAVALESIDTLPCFDVVSHLAYVAGREHVTHVWVDGRARVVDRQLQGLDEQELASRAGWWAKRLSP